MSQELEVEHVCGLNVCLRFKLCDRAVERRVFLVEVTMKSGCFNHFPCLYHSTRLCPFLILEAFHCTSTKDVKTALPQMWWLLCTNRVSFWAFLQSLSFFAKFSVSPVVVRSWIFAAARVTFISGVVVSLYPPHLFTCADQRLIKALCFFLAKAASSQESCFSGSTSSNRTTLRSNSSEQLGYVSKPS